MTNARYFISYPRPCRDAGARAAEQGTARWCRPTRADLLLRLDTIKDLVAAGRKSEAEAELERLHGVADEIYQDIEDSITGIRSNVAERGLVRALEDYEVDVLETGEITQRTQRP